MAKGIVRLTPPPAPSPLDPITVNGRTYRSNGALFLDVPAVDAVQAAANGWGWVALVGTTADRPAAGDWDYPQLSEISNKFIDTTLGKMIQWDPATLAWRDCVTLAVV